MASICSFKYRTFMNVLAISPYLGMAFLQGQNIKRKIVQKMDKIEEKIDKLEQIVIEDKKKQIVSKTIQEDDNIEKFNTIREETAEELNKVKAITDTNLFNQFTLIQEEEARVQKGIQKEKDVEEKVNKNEKLSHESIEKMLKNKK